MTRRNIAVARPIWVLIAGTTLLWGAVSALAGQTGQVWRTPSCGCCKAWVDHMQSKGFDLTITDMPTTELGQKKIALGVGGALTSCHTAAIGGYTIEGHVPAEDVERLLIEKPEAIGLSVPGMPAGSPGMEMGERHDAFDVLLVNKDGTSSVFAHHAAPVPGGRSDSRGN